MCTEFEEKCDSQLRRIPQVTLTLLRQTIEGVVKRFNECLPYRAWDYLVYNCSQSTSEVPGNRDDKCARLSARIEVIVWLFQVQSMKYWAGTSDEGTEHVTYRKGISDKVRHELAMGRFADYYWDLVDGGGRLPNLLEDSEDRKCEKLTQAFGSCCSK